MHLCCMNAPKKVNLRHFSREWNLNICTLRIKFRIKSVFEDSPLLVPSWSESGFFVTSSYLTSFFGGKKTTNIFVWLGGGRAPAGPGWGGNEFIFSGRISSRGGAALARWMWSPRRKKRCKEILKESTFVTIMDLSSPITAGTRYLLQQVCVELVLY